MASPNVMASSSPANQDLQRHHPETISNHNNSLISMNMDDLLKNIYDDPRPVPENFSGEGTAGDPEMTLEDFLTKSGAVREEDVVKLSPPVASEYSGVIDSVIGSVGNGNCNGNGNGNGNGVVIGGAFQGVTQQQQQQRMQYNGVSNGGGRGKRKVVVEDPPVDKATQQKQRRMIKNRESAARSRERKQAYTVELESLVTQLEEEHAKLLKEVDELNKERLKQLMEMPVAEKRRPPRLLRRTNSM